MKVMFVCRGNTCRSPMLKFMFEDHLKTLGVTDITADSAGLEAHGSSMSEDAAAVLDRRGIPHLRHVPKQCCARVLEDADAVICVSSEVTEILKKYGDCSKAVSLSEISGMDIPDPYGKGLAAYEETYETIADALPKIYAYLCCVQMC